MELERVLAVSSLAPLDEARKGRGGIDRVPPRPGADPSRNDGLRPVRAEGRLAPSGSAADRDQLAAAKREALKRHNAATRPNDNAKGRGRGRDRGRDR